MKRINIIMIALITAFTFIPAAYAHYPWININDYTPEKGHAFKISIGWGHRYPIDGFLSESDLEYLYIMGQGDEKIDVTPASCVEFTPETVITKPGAYLVAAQRKAGFYTKTAMGGKRRSKKGLSNIIKCYYSHMCMKAVVNVGEGKGKVNKVLGQAMEIIPLDNPADLKVGDFMTVKVLYNGKPYNGMIYATYSGFSTEENAFAYATKTDKNGTAKIKILCPGIWLIKADYQEPYSDPSECDVESFVATLTFEVK